MQPPPKNNIQPKPIDVGNDLREWMRLNDLDLFYKRPKIKKAREDAAKSLNRKITAREFKQARLDECEYWGAVRLKPISHGTMLNAKQWDKLKWRVESVLDKIQGKPFEQALYIIRTVASCNRHTLNGLPARLRVWQ